MSDLHGTMARDGDIVKTRSGHYDGHTWIDDGECLERIVPSGWTSDPSQRGVMWISRVGTGFWYDCSNFTFEIVANIEDYPDVAEAIEQRGDWREVYQRLANEVEGRENSQDCTRGA